MGLRATCPEYERKRKIPQRPEQEKERKKIFSFSGGIDTIPIGLIRRAEWNGK